MMNYAMARWQCTHSSASKRQRLIKITFASLLRRSFRLFATFCFFFSFEFRRMVESACHWYRYLAVAVVRSKNDAKKTAKISRWHSDGVFQLATISLMRRAFDEALNSWEMVADLVRHCASNRNKFKTDEFECIFKILWMQRLPSLTATECCLRARFCFNWIEHVRWICTTNFHMFNITFLVYLRRRFLLCIDSVCFPPFLLYIVCPAHHPNILRMPFLCPTMNVATAKAKLRTKNSDWADATEQQARRDSIQPVE